MNSSIGLSSAVSHGNVPEPISRKQTFALQAEGLIDGGGRLPLLQVWKSLTIRRFDWVVLVETPAAEDEVNVALHVKLVEVETGLDTRPQ